MVEYQGLDQPEQVFSNNGDAPPENVASDNISILTEEQLSNNQHVNNGNFTILKFDNNTGEHITTFFSIDEAANDLIMEFQLPDNRRTREATKKRILRVLSGDMHIVHSYMYFYG